MAIRVNPSLVGSAKITNVPSFFSRHVLSFRPGRAGSWFHLLMALSYWSPPGIPVYLSSVWTVMGPKEFPVQENVAVPWG